jgi:hypothetical protein
MLEIVFNDPNREIRKATSEKEVEAFQRLIYTELCNQTVKFSLILVKKCIREIRPKEIFNNSKEGAFEVGIEVN